MKQDIRGPLSILAAAALWSTGGLGIKRVHLFPLTTAGWRSVFALAALLAVGGWRELSLTALKRRAVLGTACSYALTLILFVSATRLTTAANAILLQYTSPLWVIALSHIFRQERPSRRDIAVAGGCLVGLALFFLDKISPEGFRGMIAAIASGLTMACLIVGLRHEGLRGAQSSSTAAVLAGNALCILACSPWMVSGLPSMTGANWAVIATLGIFQLGLPYLLFSKGLRHVTALQATLLGLVEPLLNPLWVWLGTGETPGCWAIAGGATIISCLAADLSTRTGHRQRT
ncbi:MAG: EamA family transporter [Acidobacteria bacterium]|nr:EamA family transporter [Acidobacteriota bacterium]